MPSTYAGVTIAALHKDKHEEVSVFNFAANAKVSFAVPDGAEILVLDGALQAQDDVLQKHSWMRLPLGDTLTVTAKNNGAKVWIKTGNLHDIKNQIKRVQAAG